MSELRQSNQEPRESQIPTSKVGNTTRIYSVTEGIQSKQTAIIYEWAFNHFLDHIKIHDLQVLLDFSPKVIKQILVDYVIWLRDEKPGKKLSRASIKVHLAAILHFFQINNDDFNLTIRNIRIHLPSDESAKDEDRPYSTEEIGQVLSADCDIRSKVAILLLSSTGMRIGALHSLQIGDLTEIKFQNVILYRVQVYARTREKYFSFCTPECAKTIQEYLNYRKRLGEDISKDKSPLIKEQFNKDNPFVINSPRFISDRAVEYLIDEVLKRSGVRNKEVHMSHGFRKFFMTQCEKSGMKSINVKMLLGHNIGVSGHYYRPSESDLLEDYMTHAADALTIDPNNRLKARVQQLESEQSLEVARQNQEIIELKERVQYQDEIARKLLRYTHALDEGRVIKMVSKDGKTKARIFWPPEEEEEEEKE